MARTGQRDDQLRHSILGGLLAKGHTGSGPARAIGLMHPRRRTGRVCPRPCESAKAPSIGASSGLVDVCAPVQQRRSPFGVGHAAPRPAVEPSARGAQGSIPDSNQNNLLGYAQVAITPCERIVGPNCSGALLVDLQSLTPRCEGLNGAGSEAPAGIQGLTAAPTKGRVAGRGRASDRERPAAREYCAFDCTVGPALVSAWRGVS